MLTALHAPSQGQRSAERQPQPYMLTLTVHRSGQVLWGRNNVTYQELAGCTQELLRDFPGAEVRTTLNPKH